MRNIIFQNDAFKDFLELAMNDKKKYIRLRKIIIETSRNPFWHWQA